MERRCTNQDPFTLEEANEIDATYLMTLRCGDIENCYDVRDLINWLDQGHTRDPLCGLEIPEHIIDEINRRALELGIERRERIREEPEFVMPAEALPERPVEGPREVVNQRQDMGRRPYNAIGERILGREALIRQGLPPRRQIGEEIDRERLMQQELAQRHEERARERMRQRDARREERERQRERIVEDERDVEAQRNLLQQFDEEAEREEVEREEAEQQRLGQLYREDRERVGWNRRESRQRQMARQETARQRRLEERRLENQRGEDRLLDRENIGGQLQEEVNDENIEPNIIEENRPPTGGRQRAPTGGRERGGLRIGEMERDAFQRPATVYDFLEQLDPTQLEAIERQLRRVREERNRQRDLENAQIFGNLNRARVEEPIIDEAYPIDKQRCNNEQDAITLDDIEEIEPQYLITIRAGNTENCYDIRGFIDWLNRGNKFDPLTRQRLSRQEIQRIYRRAETLGLR